MCFVKLNSLLLRFLIAYSILIYLHLDITSVVIPSGVILQQYAFYNNPITQITIGENVVFQHDNPVFDHPFRSVYEANGAGTYNWNGTTWVKQS